MITYERNGGKLLVKIVIEIDNIPDDTEIKEIIGYALVNLGRKVINGQIKIYEELG